MMNLKKITFISLISLAVLLCSACGCAKKDAEVATAVPTQESVTPSPSAEAATDAPQTDESAKQPKTEKASKAAVQNEKAPAPVPPSTNKEVVSAENAPKEIYWNMSGENNLTYHLKDCKQISDTESQKVTWEIVKTIGLRQCPECNPPQYEGYVEN